MKANLVFLVGWFLPSLAGQVAPTIAADVPRVVYRSSIDNGKAIVVILKEVRPTTKRAVTRPTTAATRSVPPDVVETYEVRVIEKNEAVGALLWRYEQNGWNDDSNRVKPRILAAAVLGDYLFLVDKSWFTTSVMRVRLRDGEKPPGLAGIKHLITDDDFKGPIIVSAIVRSVQSWEDSRVVLNYDRAAENQREYRLGDLFKDAPAEPASQPQRQ